MSAGCSWWWSGLIFIAGIGVGQVLLMVSLVLLTGGNPERGGDEHEGGSA